MYLKSEVYKLYKDVQFRVCLLILYGYTIIGFLTSIHRSDFFHTTAASFIKNNIDPAFLLILIGIVAPAIFASEYSWHTYKNIVPFVSRRKIFWSKVFIMVLCILVVLSVDVILNIMVAAVMTGTVPNVEIIYFLILRYVTFFIMILFLTGLLTLLSIVVKNRAVINIAVVIFTISFSAIPVKADRTTLWEYFEKSYAWGSMPDKAVLLCTMAATIVVIVMAQLLFIRQEVRL